MGRRNPYVFLINSNASLLRALPTLSNRSPRNGAAEARRRKIRRAAVHPGTRVQHTATMSYEKCSIVPQCPKSSHLVEGPSWIQLPDCFGASNSIIPQNSRGNFTPSLKQRVKGSLIRELLCSVLSHVSYQTCGMFQRVCQERVKQIF